MLPEIQAYFDACDKARTKHNEGVIELRKNWTRDNENASWTARDALDNEYNASREAARETLGKSEDKTVAFLANVTHEEYPEQSELVLRMLPLSREALEAVGPDNDWCPEFGRLYALAEEQGALPPYENPANALDIAALMSDLHDYYGPRSMDVRKKIQKHLPAIIASYINARVDPLIEGLYKYEFDTAEQFRAVINEHLLPKVTVTVPEPTPEPSYSDNCTCSQCT